MRLFRHYFLLFIVSFSALHAQEGFYYQAVIKNTDGSPLKETQIRIRIRIIEGTTTLQYEEEREETTSREGFVSFIIGENAAEDFAVINWQGELYLQDEIDTGTGYGAPTRMPLLKTPRSYISDRAISVLDNSITSASILDGTISNDDLSTAAGISFSKLSISAADIEGLGFFQSDENFTSALKTKLDGIEAGAQVTDATNVEAAGALMDSEVTNLADVKAFDPADYATAAQGLLADSALIAANNLSDLTDATTARNSLGIYSGTLNWSENADAAATVFPFTGIAGVTTNSLIIATIKSQSNGQFLESAIATDTEEITITLSGVPGANTILTYIVIN